MSIQSEIESYESGFSKEVKEIVALTGATGFGAGKESGNILWGASINIIAYKEYNSNKPAIREKIFLTKLIDDNELNIIKDKIKDNLIIRIKVRKPTDNSVKKFLLVDVIDESFKDLELENILKEELKPVIYEDDLLGTFTLDRTINDFQCAIKWMNSDITLSFENNKEEIDDYIKTAHILFNNQEEWTRKIFSYAADELLDLANDWYAESREEYYESYNPKSEEEDEYFKDEEITKERFMNLIDIYDITINSNGDFSVCCSDGYIFLGHSIIVDGNISGEFESAEMAG